MLDSDVRDDALDLEQERQTEPEVATKHKDSHHREEHNLTARELAREDSHLGQ